MLQIVCLQDCDWAVINNIYSPGPLRGGTASSGTCTSLIRVYSIHRPRVYRAYFKKIIYNLSCELQRIDAADSDTAVRL